MRQDDDHFMLTSYADLSANRDLAVKIEEFVHKVGSDAVADHNAWMDWNEQRREASWTKKERTRIYALKDKLRCRRREAGGG